MCVNACMHLCVCVCVHALSSEVRGRPISSLQEARMTTDPETERKAVETFYKARSTHYSFHGASETEMK